MKQSMYRWYFLFFSFSIILIFISLMSFGTLLHSKDLRLNNWETESNLPVIGINEQYDFVLLGSSHARTLSRSNNHLRVEKILGKKFLNLSQGGDKTGAVLDQQTYLNYFYQRGNSAKMLVYFVDPYIFFNKSLDYNADPYLNEPFRLDFLSRLLIDRPKNPQALEKYIKKIFETRTIAHYPVFEKPLESTIVASISAVDAKNRFNTLYKSSYNKNYFNNVLTALIQTLNIGNKHNAKIIMIVPPTLLPENENDHYAYESLNYESKRMGFEYYNYSKAIREKNLYYNIDHLNTEGVIFFTETLLKPILR
ncbi:MAG: hypothetical protein HY344_04830 [Candidatus Levybacteria bacterium]|nr:hypothetical protein [Candidatus Levybacteria bacterium]